MIEQEYEDRRRRLQADAEDARKTLNNARAVYARICDDLRDLGLEWREQQRKDGPS